MKRVNALTYVRYRIFARLCNSIGEKVKQFLYRQGEDLRVPGG